MTTIDIFRNGGLLVSIKPANSSTQVKQVMGDNLLNISLEDNRHIDFKIGDYCDVFGERYFINKLPELTKVSRYLWKYTIIMQAQKYDLAKAQFLFLGQDNTLREAEFSLMATADDFVNLIIENINRISSGWTKGQVVPSQPKNLTFSRQKCYDALSRLAEEFETEFWVEGKTIHLTKRSNDTGYTFRHGRNKGLYEIVRKNFSDGDIVTRLYAFGSEKNLPSSYLVNSRRLRIPAGYNPCLISAMTCAIVDNGDGTQTFTFSWTPPLTAGVNTVVIEHRLAGSTDPWIHGAGSHITPRTITTPIGTYEFRFRSWGGSCETSVTNTITISSDITTPIFIYTPFPYLERNTDKYGIIEHTEIFEDIFPHRTGVVTAVNAGDPFEFTDSSIDFNVNDYLLPGLVAKVVFNTGQLAGYEFEVQSFNNTTKVFRIQKNSHEKLLEVPSSLLRPAIGDEYVLVDIYLPQSYIDAAEGELMVRANNLLVELSEPQVAYSIVMDPAFARRYDRIMKIGDLVWIKDDDLGLERKIRVTASVRNLVNEYQQQVEISDTVIVGTVQRIINSQNTTERNVQIIDRAIQNNGILNNKVAGTLLFENMPTTNTYSGFSEVLIEDATGKLHRKV